MEIRLLGEVEVVRDGTTVDLPPSKKTRALLAYLAVTGRPHRRDRLCGLLWDVVDDPRGALRWSLSRLRGVLDEPGRRRVAADRELVRLELRDDRIDLVEARARVGRGLDGAGEEDLEALAAVFRGTFLEGLELPEFHDFQAWCVAQREEARRLHATVLRALVDRLAARPEAAIPFARTLAQIEPLDEGARAGLLRLLGAAGRRLEAEQQYESAERLYRELGARSTGELREAWRAVRAAPTPAGAPEAPAGGESTSSVPAGGDVRRGAAAPEPRAKAQAVPGEADAGAAASTPPAGGVLRPGLVGRTAERGWLADALGRVAAGRGEEVVVLTGEPGVGKTRLLEELFQLARERGGTVFAGQAYEAEAGRPFGPWIDALRRLPPTAGGETRGPDLASFLPGSPEGPASPRGRDRLFGAVAELLAGRAAAAPPVVVALDDIQWLDADSAALLHYLCRSQRERPVLVALSAREGEIDDNLPVQKVLRGLRRDGRLAERALGALGPEETAALARAVTPDADAEGVFRESAGNPLYALELARAPAAGRQPAAGRLADLVRDRVDRLPAAAADLLRWGAVLGHTFPARRLQALSTLPVEALADALETLERHALLAAGPADRVQRDAYSFAHPVVRQAVYAELSEPRRRLMHRRAAEALRESGEPQEAVAAELAHHAALAGDSTLAARACAAAARRCLRTFANAEAASLARRGMRHAEALPDPERVPLLLELHEASLAAQTPGDPEEAARAIEDLAERAVDLGELRHARLGFHLLSFLRWERGDWSDAARQTRRAELVSRAADESQKMVAMAEAARCLALLERDLGQAEALMLEARALSRRLPPGPSAIPDAEGMLRLHQGRLDDAAEAFAAAREAARGAGDRQSEFYAMEHLVMVEHQRRDWAAARGRCDDLLQLAARFREGSEAPFARALWALTRLALSEPGAAEAVETALAELRQVDAKHRLAYVLSRVSDLDLERGEPERARERAAEALAAAEALGRPSDIVLARVVLARAWRAAGDEPRARAELAAAAKAPPGISSAAREAVARLRAEMGSGSGRRRRRPARAREE